MKEAPGGQVGRKAGSDGGLHLLQNHPLTWSCLQLSQHAQICVLFMIQPENLSITMTFLSSWLPTFHLYQIPVTIITHPDLCLIQWHKPEKLSITVTFFSTSIPTFLLLQNLIVSLLSRPLSMPPFWLLLCPKACLKSQMPLWGLWRAPIPQFFMSQRRNNSARGKVVDKWFIRMLVRLPCGQMRGCSTPRTYWLQLYNQRKSGQGERRSLSLLSNHLPSSTSPGWSGEFSCPSMVKVAPKIILCVCVCVCVCAESIS